MDILETPLGDEINKITAAGSNFYPSIEAVIHTPVGDAEVFSVLNYDIKRDYLVQYCDEITATLLVPKGQMAYRVAPYIDQLEITIIKTSSSVHGSSSAATGSAVNRYKLVLSSAIDPAMEASSKSMMDEFTLDLTGLETVSVQLFEPLMERFAMQTCGGIYRKTNAADIVKTLLVQASTDEQLDNDYKAVAVDVVEPEDAAPREHIIIPHGTPVYDAPGYIQKHAGGIYPTGLSYYYQDDKWYVFPPFDYSRYQEADRQLIIYRVPEKRMPHVEKTFSVQGSVVSIVATGEFVFSNASQTKKLSDGNGLIFTDASKVFEAGAEVAGNKALVSRGLNNNEFVSSKQTSGLNKFQLGSSSITANRLQQASSLAAREGAEVLLVWQNAAPDALSPGMQTRIYYTRDNVVREVQAVLIGVQVSLQKTGAGLVGARNQLNAALRFWVNPKEV